MHFMEKDAKKNITLLANWMSSNPYSLVQKEVQLKGYERIILAKTLLYEWGLSNAY